MSRVVGFVVESDYPKRVTVERPSDTCGPRCHPDCDGH
jgi:hypothetical protein